MLRNFSHHNRCFDRIGDTMVIQDFVDVYVNISVRRRCTIHTRTPLLQLHFPELI